MADREAAARLAARVVPLLVRQACPPEAPTSLWVLSTDQETTHAARLEAHPYWEVCVGDECLTATNPGRTFDGASWHEAGRDLREVAEDISGLVDPHVGLAVIVSSPPGHRVDPSSGSGDRWHRCLAASSAWPANHIHVLDRKRMEILDTFGSQGLEPGQFGGVHHIATDSQGNIYTAEAQEGRRAQKLVLKDMAPAN